MTDSTAPAGAPRGGNLLRILGVLLLGVLVWVLLGMWLPRGSERFYLLVPPVYLALVTVLTPSDWKGFRSSVPWTCLHLSILLVICGGYSYSMAALLLPPGSIASVRSALVREALVFAYFLLALMLVWSIARRLLRRGTYAFQERCLGIRKTGCSLNTGPEPLLPQILPTLVLFPVILPYAIGSMYLHRLKVPNPTPTRELVGRDAEDVAFVTADGLTLRGWFFPAAEPASSRTVLICHGLGANRTNFLPYVRVGETLHAHVLLFDFRGHGDSDGHTVTMGYWEKLDVLAAVDYLRRQRPEQSRQIVGVGISMGTSGLIRAAAELEPPLEAFIIDSGFASAVELTDSVLAAFPSAVRPMLTGLGIPLASLEAGCWLPSVRPIDDVHRLRAPVLFVHSRWDGFIPAEHSQRLYERAAEPKTLWIADVQEHGLALLREPEAYLRAVRQLVEPGKTGMTTISPDQVSPN